MTLPLEPDRRQINAFVETLFKYAPNNSYVSLRAFPHKGSGSRISAVRLNGLGLSRLVDAAMENARWAAQSPEPFVFCPPLAAFSNGITARAMDLTAGLALSVELDNDPQQSLATLEKILGPATAVVRSGGVWTAPDGSAHDKLHGHWRLSLPAIGRELIDLTAARRLAAIISGGDKTNVSVVHPIRWPGSWHRKAEPRMCSILRLDPEQEIDLGEALHALEKAHPAAPAPCLDRPPPQTLIAKNPEDVPAWVDAIPNDDVDWDQWNRVGMALWSATNGSPEGLAAFDRWSAKSVGKYKPIETAARWESITASPPDRIGAGTLWRMALDAAPVAAVDEFETVAIGGDTSFGPLTIQEWLDVGLPEPDPLLGSWLTTTSRSLLVAATGLGKTNFGMQIGMAVAQGTGFLHWQGCGRPRRVLYVDGEMSSRLLRRRIRDATKRLGAAPTTFFAFSHESLENFAPLNTQAGQACVERLLKRLGGMDLIIFDSVMCLTVGDMKDEESWQETLPWARSLTRRDIGQIWVHHTGHDATRSYGTKTREWQLDTVLVLEAVERMDTDVSFTIGFRKARERTPDTRADYAAVDAAIVDEQWEWTPPQVKKIKTSPLGAKFLAALQYVAEEVGTATCTIAAWRAECITRGLLNADQPRSGRSLFDKYKRELIAANQIMCNLDSVWIMRQ